MFVPRSNFKFKQGPEIFQLPMLFILLDIMSSALLDIKIKKSLPLGSLSAFMNLSIYLYLIGHNRQKLKVNPYKVFHISTSKIFHAKNSAKSSSVHCASYFRDDYVQLR